MANKERLIIDKFASPFIGDDGAVAGEWAYSKDLFVQDSHFRAGWLSPEEIGYKAMAVNISDAIVMNAVPKYALIGLGVPRAMKLSEISQINAGIKRACDEFGVQIIGGDTIGSDKILLSVTIVSRLQGRATYRSGANRGDLVAHTGELGGSLKALRTLLNGGGRANLSLNSRFVKPVLRGKFFYKAAKFITAAMDISDGLGEDLAKLALASKCGVKFTQKPLKTSMKSGEEYEILFTFSPKNRAAITRVAAKTRTKIKIIGKITKGRYENHARKHHF